MLTAWDIAEYFLGRAREQGVTLSGSKLQYLLYYSQAWHVALFDRRLFADQIEAGDDGPVLPAVLEKFKVWSLGGQDEEPAILDDLEQDHLNCILEKYGSIGEEPLRLRIQSEAPWLVARAAPSADDRFVIAIADMKLYYRYPASDIFIRVVYGLCRVFMKVGLYQAGLEFSQWMRKAWEGWKNLCSFFCMTP